MEIMKLWSISSVELKSSMTAGTPGANMEEARGVRKVIPLTMQMVPHFLVEDQFIGN